MANKQGLRLLRKSVSQFNQYRITNPSVLIDLTGANLTGADLTRADLTGTNLTGADLTEAKYNILNLLNISMGNVSHELTAELMRWDALISGADKMTAWARKNGPCPFANANLQRLFNFSENKRLWRAGSPKKNIMELWQWITQDLKIEI